MLKNEFFLNFYTGVRNTNLTSKAAIALNQSLKLGFVYRENYNADLEEYVFSYYLTGNANTPGDYVFMITLLNNNATDRVQLALKVTSSLSYAKIFFRSKGTGGYTEWMDR